MTSASELEACLHGYSERRGKRVTKSRAERREEKRGFSMNKSNQSSESVKNPKLVAALQEVLKHDDFITRSQMAAALMEARLLSPIQKQTVLTEKKGPSTWIRVESITNTEGEKYYLAFTDMDEYSKWNEDGSHDQALIMTMEDFGNILIRQVNDLKGFVINPYGENISITKQLLLSLLQQHETKMREKMGN